MPKPYWLIDPNVILALRHVSKERHKITSVIYESDLVKGESKVGEEVSAEINTITSSSHRVIRFVFTEVAEEFWI